MILSTRQNLLSLLLRTAPAGFTRPAAYDTLKFGIFSVMPADDGTGGTEFSTGGGYGYARQSLAALDANLAIAGNQVSLVAALQFDLFTGTTPAAVGFGIWDNADVLRWAFPAGGLPQSFTFNGATDTFTRAGHTFADKQLVRAFADDSLPLPVNVAADTTYYVRDANTGAGTLKIAATEGGAAIDLGSDGACLLRRWYGKAYGVDQRAVIPAGTVIASLGKL